MNSEINATELFEQAITYPDPEMKARYFHLVGLDDHKNRLVKILSLLVNPKGLQAWTEKFHPDAKKTIDVLLRRPPLVVLAGDVGSGKTELATTVGDAVARLEKIDITLLPLSLSSRGQGRVGEMTQLISAAFKETLGKVKKLTKGAVILLVDEADALAQSRENNQMHHEDKAGVNAFIRGIDSLGNGKFPAAVIMCTNRIGALDPAIKRRAAEILEFRRPNNEQRFSVLNNVFSELGLTQNQIQEIVEITGPKDGRDYGFTFSDLTQRLIPSVVLDAYPDSKVTAEGAVKISKTIVPTSPFKEN